MPSTACAVSPPARGTWNFFAKPSSPLRNWLTHDCGTSAGHRQRQESRERLTAHGGNVAKTARQAPPTDHFRSMPIPPKMHIFNREVRRHQQFMVGSQTQDCGVVPDAGHNRRPTPQGRAPARPSPNSLDELSLAFRHGITIPLGRHPTAEYSLQASLLAGNRLLKAIFWRSDVL